MVVFVDVDSGSNAFGLKRKQEDASSSLKKLKVDDSGVLLIS